jgi:RNA polymerase sigma factor (TIGR02999 family)
MSDVTQILSRIHGGDSAAAGRLLPLIYDELRSLASQRMAQENPGQTLQATALVHEAYLRLVDVEQAQQWDSRGHFFAAAAEAMRRILVESARRKRAAKRGGQQTRLELDDRLIGPSHLSDDLLIVDEALEKLACFDDQAAQLVKLRYYAGLTNPQAAEILRVSPEAADRIWAFAKAWLQQEIYGAPPDE